MNPNSPYRLVNKGIEDRSVLAEHIADQFDDILFLKPLNYLLIIRYAMNKPFLNHLPFFAFSLIYALLSLVGAQFLGPMFPILTLLSLAFYVFVYCKKIEFILDENIGLIKVMHDHWLENERYYEDNYNEAIEYKEFKLLISNFVNKKSVKKSRVMTCVLYMIGEIAFNNALKKVRAARIALNKNS